MRLEVCMAEGAHKSVHWGEKPIKVVKEQGVDGLLHTPV